MVVRKCIEIGRNVIYKGWLRGAVKRWLRNFDEQKIRKEELVKRQAEGMSSGNNEWQSGTHKLYELEDYDPYKAEYSPPYGYDLKIKTLVADKAYSIHVDNPKLLQKEVDQLMNENGLGSGFIVLRVGDDIYIQKTGKYRYLLRNKENRVRS